MNVSQFHLGRKKNWGLGAHSGKQNNKNWFSIPRKPRNYNTAYAIEIGASFSSMLIACLTQAVKEPGNNNYLLSTGRQEINQKRTER